MIKEIIKIIETNINCLDKDKKVIKEQIAESREERRLSRLYANLTTKQAQIEILNEVYSEIKSLEDKNERATM